MVEDVTHYICYNLAHWPVAWSAKNTYSMIRYLVEVVIKCNVPEHNECPSFKEGHCWPDVISYLTPSKTV